nr:MAG TPA: hypothetical protein [Caudoviricetes sp.]
MITYFFVMFLSLMVQCTRIVIFRFDLFINTVYLYTY